jgi:4'-phosphopantetheinyl transferase
MIPSLEVDVIWTRSEIFARDPDAACARELLSPLEREALDRLRPASARTDYLAAHALTRVLLAERMELHPVEVPIRASPGQKPELAPLQSVSPQSAPRLRFSLSHADGIALCALVPVQAIGADVESLRNLDDDVPGIASVFCSEREQRALAKERADQRASRLLGIWTLKEAMAKACGLGFRLDFRRITLRPTPYWELLSLRLTPFHTAAVAVRRTPGTPVAFSVVELASGLGGRWIRPSS